MYLKVADKYGMFLDPRTRQVIDKGVIVEVKKTTSEMEKRIRSKGLIVVSEEEYKEWLAKHPPTPLAGKVGRRHQKRIESNSTSSLEDKEEEVKAPVEESPSKEESKPVETPPNEKKRRFKKL